MFQMQAANFCFDSRNQRNCFKTFHIENSWKPSRRFSQTAGSWRQLCLQLIKFTVKNSCSCRIWFATFSEKLGLKQQLPNQTGFALKIWNFCQKWCGLKVNNYCMTMFKPVLCTKLTKTRSSTSLPRPQEFKKRLWSVAIKRANLLSLQRTH